MKLLLIKRWPLALALWLIPAFAIASPLKISLSSDATSGSVAVELTNTGPDAVSVLRWDTPFEATLSENVFQITPAAKAVPFTGAVPYVGRHVNRGNPAPESYLTLRPGETTKATVPLSKYYDIEHLDEYRVRFVGKINYAPAGLKRNLGGNPTDSSSGVDAYQRFISNEVSVALAPRVTGRALPASFNSCSVTQQSYIQSATESAERLTIEALTDLQGLAANERASSPRYTLWFGSYTEQRFNRVVDNFGSIRDALSDEVIRYDCTCDERGVFAYVFPIRPYDVFLCPEFHAADELGLNSRAGTIIHELSHFNVVAGTDDHAYQPPATQRLAANDPARAIDNADNYEFFAENTPDIAIRSSGGTQQPITQFTPLDLNAQTTGTVAQASSDFFQVTSGAEIINLVSNTGDADLYVYADPQLEQLVCESVSVSSDQCDVSNSGTLYIDVYGYEASNYSIEVIGQEQIEVQPEAETTITDLGALVANQPVSGAVELQSFHTYAAASGVRVVELTTVSGDADLLVFDGPPENDGVLLCVSEEYTVDSLIDSCDVSDSNSTNLQVLVFGFEASNYTLVGLGPENDDPAPPVIPQPPIVTPDPPTIDPEPPVIAGPEPEPDVPNTLVSLTGGSSGGGSVGFNALIAGIVMVWCKRRRKNLP